MIVKKNIYNMKRIIKRRIDWCKGKKKEEIYYDKYVDSVYSVYRDLYREIEGLTEDNMPIKYGDIKEQLKKEDKVIIPRMVCSITDSCTLKCKECSMLIPYLENKKEADVSLVIQDLNKILNVVDECICLEFIGGEPLLYKHLEELLRYAQENSKIKMVEITTNATLIPKEDLLQVLNNNKTLVKISEYKGNGIQKISKLKKIFQEKHIKYKILEMDRWYSYGNANKRNRNIKELMYRYYYCYDNKECRTLYNGKLFVCGRAGALYAMGKLSDNTSYLEIRHNSELSGKKIKKFYIEKKFAEACDFCDVSGDVLRSIKVAEQCE